MSIHTITPPAPHPALVKHAEDRAQRVQNRIADRITAYAGSMNFVYRHVALFAVWMILLERKPWPTLTLVVSVEAIFLSTFVMISQNRADEKRQVIAGQEWESVQLEEKQKSAASWPRVGRRWRSSTSEPASDRRSGRPCRSRVAGSDVLVYQGR